jgi:hypothetical protein
VLLGREALRRVERALRRHAFDLRRVVIVGRGPEADRARAALESDPDLRYEVAGFTGEGQGSLGRFADLPGALESRRLHEVVIADPALGREEIEAFLLSFRRLPVQVTLLATGRLAGAHHGHIDELGEDPVLVYDRGTPIGIRPAAKRALDLAVGLPLALLLLPFLFPWIVLYTSPQKRRGAPGFWARLPRFYAVPGGGLSLVGVPPERADRARGAGGEIPAGVVPFWLWARVEPPSSPEEWRRLAHGYRLRWSPTLDLSILLKALLTGGGK